MQKMNNTSFPYAVEILLNNVRTPKQFRRFKTRRAAAIFLRGVSTHRIFVEGSVLHTNKLGTIISVLDIPERG